MRSSDFDIEFRAKIDSHLREGVVVPVDGGFDAFCLADTFDKYAHGPVAQCVGSGDDTNHQGGLLVIVKEVF